MKTCELGGACDTHLGKWKHLVQGGSSLLKPSAPAPLLTVHLAVRLGPERANPKSRNRTLGTSQSSKQSYAHVYPLFGLLCQLSARLSCPNTLWPLLDHKITLTRFVVTRGGSHNAHILMLLTGNEGAHVPTIVPEQNNTGADFHMTLTHSRLFSTRRRKQKECSGNLTF